jgi:hypothetical protein
VRGDEPQESAETHARHPNPAQNPSATSAEGREAAELRITPEQARSIASLLRYAVSLNTTAGLVSPTQRRLATSTPTMPSNLPPSSSKASPSTRQ